MNGMAIIIAAALGFGLVSLAILLWTLQSGQYDDLDGDAQRILIDDDTVPTDGELDLHQYPQAGSG